MSRYTLFDSTTTPLQIGTTLLKAFLLPLGAGMGVRAVSPGVADKLGDPLLKVAGAVLAVCGLVVLVASFHLLIELGLPSLLAFAAFTLGGARHGAHLGWSGSRSAHRPGVGLRRPPRRLGVARRRKLECG